MTLPNALSLSRIPLLFVIIVALMSHLPGSASVAVTAFVIAFLTDWLDGHFARLLKQETAVGAMIDALIDKVFILGLFFYFLQVRLIPSWGMLPLIIMLSRELLITGLRQSALIRGEVIPAAPHGKIKTVVQFLSAFLLILAPYSQQHFGGSLESMAWADFFKFSGRLTFGLAFILTLTSGFDYIWRYRYLLGMPPQTAKS